LISDVAIFSKLVKGNGVVWRLLDMAKRHHHLDAGVPIDEEPWLPDVVCLLLSKTPAFMCRPCRHTFESF